MAENEGGSKKEPYIATKGSRMYFSGGCAHHGVGVILGNTFHSQLRDIFSMFTRREFAF